MIESWTDSLPAIEILKAVELLKIEKSDGQILNADERAVQLYDQLREIHVKQSQLNFERDFLQGQLKLIIGTADGIEGVATGKRAFHQNSI